MRYVALLPLFLLASCGQETRDPVNPGPGDSTIPESFTLELQQVAVGLGSPVALTAPQGDARLFVVQQHGVIRIIENGILLPTPFLDIQSRVLAGGERGLLGLAFHPEYQANGYLYVNYTNTAGHTHVERYSVSPTNPNVADQSSASLLLAIEQPYSNHNGGMILFAPDGMLLIGMGDGGSGGDPHGHGQNRSTLLGSLLRIDVSGSPYSIPPDNPFAGSATFRPEIWASGLRNPWRFSVDRVTGILYIADVGQNRLEEVNAIPVTSAAVNYGWKVMEGNECFQATSCNRNGLTEPVLVYNRQNGCSVIGGYVYRGSAMPEIQGHYFYSDYCASWLRSFRYEAGAALEQQDWDIPDIGSVLSLGEDGSGELYLLTDLGRVYRVIKGD
jgi:glucose/arabinose dehydrogenase